MRKALLVALIAGLLSPAAGAVEIKKDGWLFPNPAHAEKLKIFTKDYYDRIPGRETLVKIYRRNKDKVVFETLEVEGEIYSCQFHSKNEATKSIDVYAIVDMDGDGVFESKFAMGERANPPTWVIDRYYKKHPDQKDPGPRAASPAPSAK